MQHNVTSIHGDGPVEQPPGDRARVLAITSGKGGVGKTNFTTNMAISLARQGKRVCIFDADTGLASHILDRRHVPAASRPKGRVGLEPIPGRSTKT